MRQLLCYLLCSIQTWWGVGELSIYVSETTRDLHYLKR